MIYRVVEIEASVEKDTFIVHEKYRSKSLDNCWKYMEQLIEVKERSFIVGKSVFVWDENGRYLDPPKKLKTLYINNLEAI